MAQLLRRETSSFFVQWFYQGSIPGQGKIMNVTVFYHEKYGMGIIY